MRNILAMKRLSNEQSNKVVVVGYEVNSRVFVKIFDILHNRLKLKATRTHLKISQSKMILDPNIRSISEVVSNQISEVFNFFQVCFFFF